MLRTAWAPTFNLRLISPWGTTECWNNPLFDFTILCVTKAPWCSTHNLHTFISGDITGHELVQFLHVKLCRGGWLCLLFYVQKEWLRCLNLSEQEDYIITHRWNEGIQNILNLLKLKWKKRKKKRCRNRWHFSQETTILGTQKQQAGNMLYNLQQSREETSHISAVPVSKIKWVHESHMHIFCIFVHFQLHIHLCSVGF